VKKEAKSLIQNHSLPTSVYSQIIGGFGSDSPAIKAVPQIQVELIEEKEF
jgi:hypothetical protein